MADHLPECPWLLYSPAPCICDRLRKAEQRASLDVDVAYYGDQRHKQGYTAALTAAREALIALPVVLVDIRKDPFDQRQIRQAVLYDDALAAIDALRNPGLADLSGIPEEDFR